MLVGLREQKILRGHDSGGWGVELLTYTRSWKEKNRCPLYYLPGYCAKQTKIAHKERSRDIRTFFRQSKKHSFQNTLLIPLSSYSTPLGWTLRNQPFPRAREGLPTNENVGYNDIVFANRMLQQQQYVRGGFSYMYFWFKDESLGVRTVPPSRCREFRLCRETRRGWCERYHPFVWYCRTVLLLCYYRHLFTP